MSTPAATTSARHIIVDTPVSDTISAGIDALRDLVSGWGLTEFWAEALAAVFIALAIITICGLANLLARWVIHGVVHGLLAKRTSAWTKALVKERVLERLSHLVPAALLALALPAFAAYGVDVWLQPLVEVYAIGVLLLVCYGLLEVAEVVVAGFRFGEKVPTQGISQALKLVLTFIAIVLALSVVFDKSPLYLLSGVGALAAVMMLVFKDSILGLVAGIQVSANDMVRVGDWITIPSKGVDGDVEEISLTTVKVRAFDKTIALVPAYDLISNPFTNWRGMAESGGRRIKRCISIDISTIKYVGKADLVRYSKFSILREELDRRIGAIDEWNAEHEVDTTHQINGRQQTNVGLFRAYVEAYLQQHPKIHEAGFTFLVRHLASGPEGLPIELYVFANDNRWVPYEQIQADIFDHLLAAVPEFDLAVFQQPTGRSIAALQAS